MIVRVRCSQGTWRIEIPGPSSRIGELKAAREKKGISKDRKGRKQHKASAYKRSSRK